MQLQVGYSGMVYPTHHDGWQVLILPVVKK